MFYSLAHLEDSFHADNTFKVLAYTPCFYPSNLGDYTIYDIIIAPYDDYGVYAYNGPDWETDKTTVCDNVTAASC